MIDVHVLTLPHERQDWLQTCLQSLEGHPVQVHVVEGIQNHVGRGRMIGFSQGASEWVSFVDDDDRVKPGAFASVLESIAQFPQADAVFTREELIDETGALLRPAKAIPERFSTSHLYQFFRWDHHLMVFRRRKLEPLLPKLMDFPMACNSFVSDFFLKHYACVMNPYIGYQWRQHPNNWCRRAVSVLGQNHGVLLG
jgi:hypothetical protein